MDDDQLIYLPETIVSEHTCRPVFKSTKLEVPTFWCETCKFYMDDPSNAIKHFASNYHQGEKRRHERNNSSYSTAEPSSKKPKFDRGMKNIDDRKRSDIAISRRNSMPSFPSAQSYNPLECKMCEVTFTGQVSANEHFQSKKHATRLGEINPSKTMEYIDGHKRNDIAISKTNIMQSFPSTQSNNSLEGKMCEVTFTGQVSADEHFQSKKHATRLAEIDPSQTVESITEMNKKQLTCETCSITFTSDAHALQHFKGKRHSEALAKQYHNDISKRGGADNLGVGRGSGRGGTMLGRGGSGRGGTMLGRGRGNSMGRGRSGNNVSRGGGSNQQSNTNRGGGSNRGRGSGHNSHTNNLGVNRNESTFQGRSGGGTGTVGGSRVRVSDPSQLQSPQPPLPPQPPMSVPPLPPPPQPPMPPISSDRSYDNFYSNSNPTINSGGYTRFYTPHTLSTSNGATTDQVSQSYSQKINEINSNIDQLKRKLGSLYE